MVSEHLDEDHWVKFEQASIDNQNKKKKKLTREQLAAATFSGFGKTSFVAAFTPCFVSFLDKNQKRFFSRRRVKSISCSDRILTCRIKSIRSPAKVGLVVTDLITSPVVSWEGWETPPPQHRGSAVILCSTTGVVRPLCSCGDLLLSSARHCLRLVMFDWNTFSSWMSIFLSFFS